MIRKNEILKAFNFRHACKIFDENKKIPEDDFETILESARLSPSSFGFEPWRFLIVQDQSLREDLKAFTWGAKDTLPTASHFVIIVARKAPTLLAESEYITHMMYDVHHIPKEAAEARRAKYKIFQEKDFDLLSDPRYIFEWANKQCYIALANMMTTAAMLGIDSCPIEGFEAKKIEKLMHDKFDIDSEIFGVSVMVAFGYRKVAQKTKTRQAIKDIVKWY